MGDIVKATGLGEGIILPSELGIMEDIAETGKTYEENSLLKLNFFVNRKEIADKYSILAEDSGIEIDCMPGRFGVYSHREVIKSKDIPVNKQAFNSFVEIQGAVKKSGIDTCRYICFATYFDKDTKQIYKHKGVLEGRISTKEIFEKDVDFSWFDIIVSVDTSNSKSSVSLNGITEKKNEMTLRWLPNSERAKMNHRFLAVQGIADEILQQKRQQEYVQI